MRSELTYSRAALFSEEKEREVKEEYLNLTIRVRPISFEGGKTLVERIETIDDFERLYLNPSKITGVQGKVSKTLLLPTETVKIASPAVMFDVTLDSETERYVEKKVGTGLLYMSSKRLLFQVKPSNLRENYLQWSVEFREIFEVSTGVGFKFSGGPKERLQIKYAANGEVKTADFASSIESVDIPKKTLIYRPLAPKEWEGAILRQILRTEISL